MNEIEEMNQEFDDLFESLSPGDSVSIAGRVLCHNIPALDPVLDYKYFETEATLEEKKIMAGLKRLHFNFFYTEQEKDCKMTVYPHSLEDSLVGDIYYHDPNYRWSFDEYFCKTRVRVTPETEHSPNPSPNTFLHRWHSVTICLPHCELK